MGFDSTAVFTLKSRYGAGISCLKREKSVPTDNKNKNLLFLRSIK